MLSPFRKEMVSSDQRKKHFLVSGTNQVTICCSCSAIVHRVMDENVRVESLLPAPCSVWSKQIQVEIPCVSAGIIIGVADHRRILFQIKPDKEAGHPHTSIGLSCVRNLILWSLLKFPRFDPRNMTTFLLGYVPGEILEHFESNHPTVDSMFRSGKLLVHGSLQL